MTAMVERATAPSERDRAARSPLLLDGLIEFKRQKWGVVPQRVQLSAEDSGVPAVEALYYTDQRGRIEGPRISPYMPVVFTSTPTESRARLDRQWLSAGGLLAADMRARGVSTVVALAPEVTDVRPWHWEGFRSEVRYTFQLDLPYDDGLLDPAVRRQIAKGSRNGFRAERVSNMDDVMSCMLETQNRKEFRVDLTARDLELARDLVGEDAFRTYVCYAPDGEPASGGIILHQPGGRALYWVFGTKSSYLQAGATQFVIRHILDDLSASGAVGLDFVGAMVPGVAAMKATWGATLVPYFGVDGGRIRALAKQARQYWHFRRNGDH